LSRAKPDHHRVIGALLNRDARLDARDKELLFRGSHLRDTMKIPIQNLQWKSRMTDMSIIFNWYFQASRKSSHVTINDLSNLTCRLPEEQFTKVKQLRRIHDTGYFVWNSSVLEYLKKYWILLFVILNFVICDIEFCYL